MKHGLLYGGFSGLSWALYSIGLYSVLNLYGSDLGSLNSMSGLLYLIATALTIAILDGVITLGFECFVLWKQGKLPIFWSTLWSKKSLGILPAAILAGPFGLIPYAIASYSSIGIAGAVSALYPVIGAIAAYLILKEQLNGLKMTGIVLAVVGTGVIYLFGEQSTLSIIAFVLALITAFGWGLEAIFGARLMKANVDPIVTIAMRHAYAIVLYLMVLIPVVWILQDPNYIQTLVASFAMNSAYPAFAAIQGYHVVVAIFVISSICGAISYMSWYMSMHLVGVATAMVLNISYGLWIVLLTSLPPFSIPLTPALLVGAMIIFFGSVCVILSEQRPKKRKTNA
ncbi:MAG: hypothetical protein ACRCZJ_06800 [Erysipelotrichaceae bacterium]